VRLVSASPIEELTMEHANGRDAAYEAFPEIPIRDALQVGIEVPLLLELLRIPTGGRILEVGCGSGAALVELSRRLRPDRLIGADVDASLLKEAAGRLQSCALDCELLHADVHALPLPASSVDVVIDFGTCYHIPDPESALREVARVLRPGGLFVHETPMSQLIAHPIRSFGRVLPWKHVPSLRRTRTAWLWSARTRIA
jgi:ubiquinone/menaquinone biosynthesis C-methylase UbiE